MQNSETQAIDASQNRNRQVIASSAQGEWVGCWTSSEAGEQELELPEQYAVLVVLEGEITLTFNKIHRKTITQKSLVVVDREQITSFKWAVGTALLEFIPPTKIFRFFSSCSSAFQIPCSTIVPVRPALQTWIDELMVERLQPKELLTEVRRRDYCVRLVNILRSYPPQLVGELLVPFHACSLSGEKKCKGEVCK